MNKAYNRIGRKCQRSPEEVYFALLNSLGMGDNTQSDLMRAGGFPSERLHRYIDDLIESDILQKRVGDDPKSGRRKVTLYNMKPRGWELLSKLREIDDLVPFTKLRNINL